MTIDLTGGIDPAREYVFAERPDDPEMRESVSFWVSDDRGKVGLTRVGIEAMAANWDAHGLQVNVGFPDGRVFRLRQDGKTWPAVGPRRQADRVRCRPARLRVRRAVPHLEDEVRRRRGSDVELRPRRRQEGRAARRPPLRGRGCDGGAAVGPGRARRRRTRAARVVDPGRPHGRGERCEQLFRCTGSVQVGGDEHRFSGSGLRIRRQGIRRLAGFWGHCWQSALFPSGKAFGCMAYPPRADGEPTFNEGYLFDGDGDLVPARFAEAPWLRKLQPLHEDVSLVLETRRGKVRIEGETILSTYDIHHNDKSFSMESLKKEMPVFPALQQAGVRYRWDGEETFGMLERSSPLDKISRDPSPSGARRR